MTEYQSNMVLATKTYNVVGTRPIRHDGADKVTGAAKYGADFNPAIVLYGKVLRSPHAHAAIRSIDTSAAEALPGVKAVVTNRDFHTKPGRAGLQGGPGRKRGEFEVPAGQRAGQRQGSLQGPRSGGSGGRRVRTLRKRRFRSSRLTMRRCRRCLRLPRARKATLHCCTGG